MIRELPNRGDTLVDDVERNTELDRLIRGGDGVG